MVFGFLAVVGKRHIAPQPCQLCRHHRTQGNAFVSRTKHHVEFHVAIDQQLGVKMRQPRQLGTIVKQAGIEKIGRKPPRFGFEFPKTQDATFQRESNECLRQIGWRCALLSHRGFLVHTHQP